MSYKNIHENISEFMSQIIIRTSSLNNDFYVYSDKGKSNFMKLTKNRKEFCPKFSELINKSSISSKTYLENNFYYFSSYHIDLIKIKSNLSFYIFEKANSEISSLIK